MSAAPGLLVLALAVAVAGCAGGETISGGAAGRGGGAAGTTGTAGAGAAGTTGLSGHSGAGTQGGVGAAGVGAGGAAGGEPSGRGGGAQTAGASGTGGAAGGGGASAGGVGGCDPLSNAGCGVGAKCTVLQTATSFTLGCGSKGTKGPGETCTQATSGQMQTGDDCADGMACFALQGESKPTCRQFCMAAGAMTACLSGMACTLQINQLPGSSFCQTSISCTLATQTRCPSGQACYLVSTGATCAPAGTAAPGAGCASANDCARGSTCVTTGGVSTCASFCALTAGGTPACAATGTGGPTCTATPGTPPEPSTGICR